MRPGRAGTAFRRAAAAGGWLAVSLGAASALLPSPRPAASAPAAGKASIPLPESERFLRRVVVGVNANRPRYVLMPDTADLETGAHDERAGFLRRQIYWLSFELQHGQIFKAVPGHTTFFVAVPGDRSGRGGPEDEERTVRAYLRDRVGWSAETIAARVRFFRVPDEVPYVQDMAQGLGYDARGRLVYALGLDCPDQYREAIETLVRRFPDEFDVRRFPGLSTEGGDLNLVRLPGGRVALLVGRNRIKRYVETRYGLSLDGRPVAPERIEEAKEAFRRAFGVEAIVIGEEALRRPELGNPELFHLDMLAATARGRDGYVAFVPTYQGAPVDALTHVHLPPEMVARLQREYDAVAAQMAGLGYAVARPPFADHPVRGPVNVGKFTDPASGKKFVLLGRYPYHLELSGGHNPQRDLQLLFETFDADVAAWRRSRSPAAWKAVRGTIARLWRELDSAVESPNPLFELQRKVYESNGVGVIPVPIYPTGEGGIHCLVLE